MYKRQGTSYKEVATQQMLAVPYALYAERAGNSGNDVSAHNFIVTGDGEDAYCLATGAELSYEASYFGFEFSVSYLDGEDQKVEFTVEGLPNEAVLDDKSISGAYGKYIDIDVENAPAGTYPLTLKLKNKYGMERVGKLIWTTSGSSGEPSDAMNIAQSERDVVLTAVISDLETAQEVQSLFDTTGEITSDEARILLLESHLLKKDWQAVSQMTDETGVAAFIKKLATWKADSTQPAETTEASLMEEYMDSFHSSHHRGNLYLNVLEYSAAYFDMDAYKALLPIPQSEQHKNPNIEQNDGYN